jgi:DNA mismatch repair protein MLH1
VNWEIEKDCFESFLRELAFFYSPRPFFDRPEPSSGEGGETTLDASEPSKEEVDHQLWQLEHVLFPSFRRHTAWPKESLGREVAEVANLPALFRVFERC